MSRQCVSVGNNVGWQWMEWYKMSSNIEERRYRETLKLLLLLVTEYKLKPTKVVLNWQRYFKWRSLENHSCAYPGRRSLSSSMGNYIGTPLFTHWLVTGTLRLQLQPYRWQSFNKKKNLILQRSAPRATAYEPHYTLERRAELRSFREGTYNLVPTLRIWVQDLL